MASKLQSMSRLFAEFSASPALAPLNAPLSSSLAAAAGAASASASSSQLFGGEEEGDAEVNPLAASAPSVLDASYNSRMLGAGLRRRMGERQYMEGEGDEASVGGQQLRSLSSFLPEHSPEREEEGAASLLAASYPPPSFSSIMGGVGVGVQGQAHRGEQSQQPPTTATPSL